MPRQQTVTHTGQIRAQRGGRAVVNHGATVPSAEFKIIPIVNLVPSKTNPRTHFDDDYLQELGRSIAEKGIIEPLIVRPLRGGKFEIVVGECRYRSSKIANLSSLPCLVRALTDELALEIQLIENLHRRDLTPLEEAAGFRALIKTNPDKHSATTIAGRIGKSPSWVWDLMKLLDLVPEAKKLLDESLITVNHAIPIARLKPEQQNKVITSGLFREERAESLDFGGEPDKTPGKYDQLTAVTVRELGEWISDHVRFNAKQAAIAAPLLFESVAEKIDEAAALPGRGKKVIAITRDSFVRPEAKDESERTFGPQSWKRADGTSKTTHVCPNKWADSPECEHSIMGCMVVGPGQGEAFKVCIARDECEIHWGKEIKAKAQRAKQSKAGDHSKSQTSKKPQWQINNERDAERRRKGAERWQAFGPALKRAMVEKLNAMPAALPKPVFQALRAELGLPKDTKPADLALALLKQKVRLPDSHYSEYWARDAVSWAKTLGVNVKACEPKKEKPQTSGEKKKAA